jgi:hypothetical protein
MLFPNFVLNLSQHLYFVIKYPTLFLFLATELQRHQMVQLCSVVLFCRTYIWLLKFIFAFEEYMEEHNAALLYFSFYHIITKVLLKIRNVMLSAAVGQHVPHESKHSIYNNILW